MEDTRPTIRFFGKNGRYAIFSNFADVPLTINGKDYATSEHYFQSMKFIKTDPEYAEEVRLAATPLESKKLGRSRAHKIDPEWTDTNGDREGESIVVMRRVLFCKALQNANFRDMLLNTPKDSLIIEASRFDSYWGEGPDKRGKNMLGKLLMELRDRLVSKKDIMFRGE